MALMTLGMAKLVEILIESAPYFPVQFGIVHIFVHPFPSKIFAYQIEAGMYL
jgi:hypothetical protein